MKMNLHMDEQVTKRLPDGCGFTCEMVSEIIAHKNQIQLIAHEGEYVATIYATDFGDFWDVACARERYGVARVLFAFRMFHGLTDVHLHKLTPLEMVQALAERFGMDIFLQGGERRRFIREVRLPVPFLGDTEGLLDFYPGPDEVPIFFNLAMPANESTDIVLAFCLDGAAYRKWRRNHEQMK